MWGETKSLAPKAGKRSATLERPQPTLGETLARGQMGPTNNEVEGGNAAGVGAMDWA